MNKPIYGHVGAPALPPPHEDPLEAPPSPNATRNSWKKGLPRGTKKSDVFGPKAKLPPAPPVPRACEGCKRHLDALSLPMVSELVRIARDRLSETNGDARTDLLYLAARFDGYCSLQCWRHHAPESGG